MKKTGALLLAVCTAASGCGTKTADYGKSLGQATEQVMETETTAELASEETEETEEAELIPRQEEETEKEPDSLEIMDAEIPWNFTLENPEAYDMGWEELKSLRQEREITKGNQETDLPRELVELLEGILVRQLSEGNFSSESFSPDDILEPYRAKDCEVDFETAMGSFSSVNGRKGYADSQRTYEAYVADLNGNGREEVILLSRTDGTAGHSYLEIWQRPTEEMEAFELQRYTYWYRYTGLLFLDGHYYYVAEAVGYSSGKIEEYLVFSFLEDGTVSLDKVALKSKEGGKQWKKLYENEALGSKILDSVQSYIESRREEIEGGPYLQGGAEIPYQGSGYDFAVGKFHLWGDTSNCTVVDLDNDGEMECCCKRAIEGQLTVEFIKKQGSKAGRLEYGIPGYSFIDEYEHGYCFRWHLWFEEFDGKNYIFSVNRMNGSSDDFLIVQFIQDGKLYPVMNYLLLDKKECEYGKAEIEDYIDLH